MIFWIENRVRDRRYDTTVRDQRSSVTQNKISAQ